MRDWKKEFMEIYLKETPSHIVHQTKMLREMRAFIQQLIDEKEKETARKIWKICAKHLVSIKVKWEIESNFSKQKNESN